MYDLIFTKQAKKDIDNLIAKKKKKLKDILLNRISKDPFSGKKLVGELNGYYSMRLTKKDRIVYRIENDKKIIFILMCKTHYHE